MKRTIELWIDGKRADLSDGSLIQFNYTQEDLTNPTIVENAYSQSVTLPGTPTNNKIFSAFWRTDRRTGSLYDAAARVPFLIFAGAELMQRGYCKLNTVQRKSATSDYSVTLYGGLGGFFYTLMYDADGDKLSLADLDYDMSLDFAINRRAVLDAWEVLMDGYTEGGSFDNSFDESFEGESYSPAIWQVLNFAPAYNGIPTENFSADKAVAPVGTLYGLYDNRVDEDGNVCRSSNGHTIVSLDKAYDEWGVKDLRSYLQRPVISIKAIFEALQRLATANGYTLTLGSDFFNSSNPYYTKTWLTLPRLNTIKQTSQEAEVAIQIPQTQWQSSADLEIDLQPKPVGTAVDIDVTVQLYAYTSQSLDEDAYYFGFSDLVNDKEVRNGVVMQLVGYDADGNIIEASEAKTAQSLVHGTSVTSNTILTASGYTPKGGASAGATYTGKFEEAGLETYRFTEAIPFAISGNNITRLVLYVRSAQVQNDFAGQYVVTKNDLFDGNTQATALDDRIDLATVRFVEVGGGAETYQTVVSTRSGVTITKELLLSGSKTPADYLISFAKTFGLVFLYDNISKTVTVTSRDAQYSGAQTIDLTRRIATDKGITIKPYSYDARWYEWSAPMQGAFADYYEKIYGRAFGMQRVNTSYPFNATHKAMLSNYAFTGAAEVMRRSKYNMNVESGKPCPAPFVEGGNTYTLYNGEGEGVDFDIVCPPNHATFTHWNASHPSYDAVGRPQFEGEDNAAIEQRDTLLFYDGIQEGDAISEIAVTDDTPTMAFLNEDTPCWLLGADLTLGGLTRLPHFGRYVILAGNVTHSLDFGHPAELAVLSIAEDTTAPIYERRWAAYLADRYDKDSKVMTAYVRLDGLQVGENLLRQFYWYDNSLWVLNRIINHSLRDDAPTQCEFVQVQDTDNYDNGQI